MRTKGIFGGSAAKAAGDEKATETAAETTMKNAMAKQEHGKVRDDFLDIFAFSFASRPKGCFRLVGLFSADKF
jgi:hypothetical protein